MPPTILDLAKMTGFSKATVSRAFINPELVSETTRKKIYDIAIAMHYVPNAIARAMVRQKTDNIAFIVYEQQYPVILNPFYSQIMEAIMVETNKRGYSMFIATDREIRQPNGTITMKKQMDGVIIAGQTDFETINSFRNQNMPVVLLNNKLDMEGLVSITSDEYDGTLQAMDHLFTRGHRRIALIHGRFNPFIYESRYKAYIDSLQKREIEPDPLCIHTIDPTIPDAYQCTRRMLQLENPPSAIFCTNDTIAVGAMKAVLRSGLRIPQDMAIVGYDDSHSCIVFEPELTSVHVETELMGKSAVIHLIAQIEGWKPEIQAEGIKPRLIVRNSS